MECHATFERFATFRTLEVAGNASWKRFELMHYRVHPELGDAFVRLS